MKRILLRVAAGLVVFYAGDFLVMLLRSPRTAQIQVQQYYAVREKGNKIEYLPADPANLTCSYSLLPQLGYTPCWYLSRHRLHEIYFGPKDSWTNY